MKNLIKIMILNQQIEEVNATALENVCVRIKNLKTQIEVITVL